MTKRIFDCELFKDYESKEYEVITEHKIFGKNVIRGTIREFIDDDDKVGFIIHGKEIFCRKILNKSFDANEENGTIFLSDELMKIIVKWYLTNLSKYGIVQTVQNYYERREIMVWTFISVPSAEQLCRLKGN